MIKEIIQRLLRRRHFWRTTGFDELSEIYASMMVRSLSVNLAGIFVPVYMYRLGYSLVAILWIFAWYFIFRAFLFDILAGVMTARFGPKHTIIASYFMLILSTGLFLFQPHLHCPIWILGAVWGGSVSLFTIPYYIDFSKIKHKAHGGKELGYVNIMDRTAALLGPLIGGAVATIFGGQYIFLVASVLLLLGIIPLLKTKEPIPTHHKLDFGLIHLRQMKRDLISFMFYGIELTLGGWIWTLYLAMFVLTGQVYAKFGILASMSVVASITAAFVIGRLVDKARGRQLLRFSTIANAGLHAYRIFVTTYPMAFLVNILNEGVSIGYRLPYYKGMCDAADEDDGRRVAYFVTMEIIGSMTKATIWLILIILTFMFSDHTVLAVGFFTAGLASLLIMTEKFKALKP